MYRSGEVRSRVIQGSWQPESPLQKDSLVLPEPFPHDFILRQAVLGSYFLMGPSPSCMEENGLRAHPRVAMPGQAGSVHCPRLSAWLTTHCPEKGPVWATCTTAGRSCTGLWAPHLFDLCFCFFFFFSTTNVRTVQHSSRGQQGSCKDSAVQASLTLPGTPPTLTPRSPLPPTLTRHLNYITCSGLPQTGGDAERHVPEPKTVEHNVCWGYYGCSEEGLMNPIGNITTPVFMSCGLLSKT